MAAAMDDVDVEDLANLVVELMFPAETRRCR